MSKIIDNNEDGTAIDSNQIFDQFKEIETIVIDTRKRYDETKT